MVRGGNPKDSSRGAAGQSQDDVDAAIDELVKSLAETLGVTGVMVTHGTNIELTNKGRALTKRQMPY